METLSLVKKLNLALVFHRENYEGPGAEALSSNIALSAFFKRLHFFPSEVSTDREFDRWFLHFKSPQQGGFTAALTQPGTGQM